MHRRLFNVLAIVALLSSLLATTLPVGANPPAPDDTVPASQPKVDTSSGAPAPRGPKPIDQPNLKDYMRMRERQRMLEAGQTAQASALAQTGTDRVLVVLVDFVGTDVFTWTQGVSHWDPLGRADPNENTGTLGDCSNIITQTQVFTYSGPAHNQLPVPLSPTDRSGDSIWTADFSPQWFTDFMFGNGVVISYTMQDGTPVHESFVGKSVAHYYSDLSKGTYTVTGDVIGWLGVPHSTWYYDADQCPGSRSGVRSQQGGVIPGAGNARQLVRDALNAVNAISNTITQTIDGGPFDWHDYDGDGDGIIDRLWIVHAGYGEEDSTTMLNRTDYGEAAVWSHSSQVTPPYSVTPDVAAGAYIVMPENGGIGVFAHEYAHNLGADDLYAYGEGETSAGFWALQADDWTGYPIGFQPPAPDPWHLDNWGWLNPYVITDPSQVYTVTLGQASYFDTNTAPGTAYRGAKIVLPAGQAPLAVPPWQGSHYWWGGKLDVANGRMTTANPIAIPAGGTTSLSFDLVYDVEDQWDYLWVQVSPDGGTTWNTLTNTNTVCTHVSGWIGGLYGFPDDLCGAGIGGFTDYNANWPDPEVETFDLTPYAGQNVLFRLWYMTDWGTTYTGVFVDNLAVTNGGTTLFADDAEAGDAKWAYTDPWIRSDGNQSFSHNYYLQWRNTHLNGGYDSALGDSRWRYGPANTGLLVWYNNNSRTDNEVFDYLTDFPAYGPKGRMLVVDSHPEPYREPAVVAAGYNNEAGNVAHRSSMRDAPFTLQGTVPFTMSNSYAYTSTVFQTAFPGRPAVSTFNDALGYYPGAENVPGGPVGQTTPRWMTKQWDASVVVPSKAFYGVKAPGYTGNTRLRFGCALNALGQVLCYGYGAGLGYDGGTGNPGDYNGQYGWHVELIAEGADHTWATVRVYNEQVAFESNATATVTPQATQTYNVNYQTVVRNDGATVAHNLDVTYTLDAKLTLVSFAAGPAVGTVNGTRWHLDTLDAGQAVTLTLVARGTAGWTPDALSTRVNAHDSTLARGPWTLTTNVVPQYVTVLHTNDFHGNLIASGSNPGAARMAAVINGVRTSRGAANVALLDAGDIMQSTLLSNLFKGESTIDVYKTIGYNGATLGNHEFDWGQAVLISRTQQAGFPFVAANLVLNDTGSCTTAGWDSPSFVQPWVTQTVGAPGQEIVLGILGVTSQETPYLTMPSATAGLCFKDPADSILHYYDAVRAAGAQAIVVLSHLGNTDGGYGYGFTVYGDQTLAGKLFQAGKPADLIIGGHSHTDLAAAQVVNGTTVVQAHYAGRKVGRADIARDPATGRIAINWQRLVVSTTGPEDPAVKARVDAWANDPWYQSQINRVVGYSNIDLLNDYNGNSTLAEFVDDAIYNDLNHDAQPGNDMDMFFNNAGGIRGSGITSTLKPITLTHGLLYSVLPFGNQTVVGTMTGAQIMELLDQSATLFKGAIQVSGIRYTFYSYRDALPGPQPWAWGAYSVTVKNRATGDWEPLVMTQTYRVGTNEFLAPAGQDGYTPFKYMTNISYWGDMLDGVERWVSQTYSPTNNAYNKPLDDRIARDGTDAGGNVIPVTVLHHNDSHGNLAKGTYVGYTQLATLINQERAHNPSRSLLLNGGDQIQGDAMMYYFKSAPTGYAADGTSLPPELTTQPMMAAMNAMTYTAMTLGNHEFNFGREVFTSVLKQANFPLLQANLYDDGRYGIDQVPVRPYITTTLGDIKVAVLGLGNHRVPNYELPSNIPGLRFTNPITEAQARVPALDATNDVVLALTHIGFTSNPKNVEVDLNVDTSLAAQTNGIDAIIGGHSHTDPSKGDGAYKYLPAFVGSPDNTPVLINQAYRYNNTLGQMVLGLLPKAGGGYEVVARSGRYISVPSSTPEDARIKAIVTPYVNQLNTYNNKIVGRTTAPIDTLQAYTQETNGANLQADAAVWELAQHGIDVDLHLSGAMSNRKVADTATPANPYTLTVSSMFSLMPYENSLVVLRMNGPQLKAVLERGYRNYYYYKYVSGYGGYSYYTTCMLDINSGGQITYRDTYPILPSGNNVESLSINGQAVDFANATKYYHVSTVNYLAAGSCNFNDGGVSLWPLNQTEHDTQYYVRDAVIDYVTAQGTVTPTIEGRLVFLTKSVYLPIIVKNMTP